MRRVIFDTNIYGNIALEENSIEIIRKLSNNKDLIIFGFDVVEKELQKVPEEKTLRGKKFREIVSQIYLSLIKLKLKNSPLVNYLAKSYLKLYKNKVIRQKIKKIKLENLARDFEIVAIASLKNLDIVFSDDYRTMTSNFCIKVYKKINKENGLRTPEFLNYNDLKRGWF